MVEDVSFNAPEKAGQRWVIDAEVCIYLMCYIRLRRSYGRANKSLTKCGSFLQDVKKPLGDLLEKVDVSKFIL